MATGERLGELWVELQRVGVDAENFPAVLAMNYEDAMRVLHALPDSVGPEAFLAALRAEQERMKTETDLQD